MTEINKHIRKVVAEGIIERLSKKIEDCEECGQGTEEQASWSDQTGCLIDLRDTKNIIEFLKKFV